MGSIVVQDAGPRVRAGLTSESLDLGLPDAVVPARTAAGPSGFDPLNDDTIREAVDCYFDESCDSEALYGPIEAWDVSEVTNMRELFCGDEQDGVSVCTYSHHKARVFDADISAWDVAKVKDTSYFLYRNSRFNTPLQDWDVSQVIEMEGMFAAATAFDQPLGAWAVERVTDFSYMFAGATRYNQPLNDWNVASLTDARSMFDHAVVFNQPLNQWANKWNASRLDNLREMFFSASAFDQYLSWVVGADVSTRSIAAGTPCASAKTSARDLGCGITKLD